MSASGEVSVEARKRLISRFCGTFTPVFGLAYLLGIKWMARIRNIKELVLRSANTAVKPFAVMQHAAASGAGMGAGARRTASRKLLRATAWFPRFYQAHGYS
jgi:hypothetical protein